MPDSTVVLGASLLVRAQRMVRSAVSLAAVFGKGKSSLANVARVTG